jgi:hypothetical protein
MQYEENKAPGHSTAVMAGLAPAIHVFCLQEQDVDARDKRGHDEGWFVAAHAKKAPVETGA